MKDVPSRGAGRPSEQIQARERLILCARELFTVMAYENVSTRLIAKKAGVNIAMIRYYFKSKSGLFESMLRETVSPLKQQLNKLIAESNQKNLVDLMRVYYREMMKIPQFPKLVSQVMHMPAGRVQRDLIERVFYDLINPIQNMLFERLIQRGVVRADMDPDLCRMSYISLMAFPFLVPTAVLELHHIQLTEDFMERLIEHNIRVMEEGFISP